MAEKNSNGDKVLYCSFCGKSQQEVKKLERKAQARAKAIADRAKQVQSKQQALNKLNTLLNQGILTQEEYQVLSKNLGK